MGEKTVVFYECQNVDKQAKFDRVAALAEINDLDDDDWTVSHSSSTDDLAVIVDQEGDPKSRGHLRFLRVRSDAPFVLSAARKLTPVQVQQDERISEFTHVVLFKDGYMGAITSRDAPRHKWLSWYLQEASSEYTHIVNLYRSDVIDRLKELRKGGLTNVTVKVQASKAQQIQKDKNLKGFKSFWNAGKGTEAVVIGTELSVGRFNATLSDSIAADALELADVADELEQMIVTGKDEDGKRDEINMKTERIAWPVEIDPAATDSVHYAAIVRARKELKATMGPLKNATRGT